MRYQGGKAAIASQITSTILHNTPNRFTYWEPFVGGASVLEKSAPHFVHTLASDSHPDLIALYQALTEGWLPPSDVSRDMYNSLRHSEVSALRGFVGFGCSFGGKWFGGYQAPKIVNRPNRAPENQNICRSTRNVLLRALPAIRSTVFMNVEYNALAPDPETVVYCDPPYAGTTGYSKEPFDSSEFWNTAQQWASNGSPVFVSEYKAPPGWESVWSAPKRVTLKHGENSQLRTEHLFVWRG